MRNQFRLTPDGKVRLVENDVEEQCIQIAHYRGYWESRNHIGKFWTWDRKRVITGHTTGTPDWTFVHAIYPGFLLETKRPGAKPTPEQEKQIAILSEWGPRLAVCVADNKDYFAEWLDKHERMAIERMITMSRAP